MVGVPLHSAPPVRASLSPLLWSWIATVFPLWSYHVSETCKLSEQRPESVGSISIVFISSRKTCVVQHVTSAELEAGTPGRGIPSSCPQTAGECKGAGLVLASAKSLPRTPRGESVGRVFCLGTCWLHSKRKGQQAGGAA